VSAFIGRNAVKLIGGVDYKIATRKVVNRIVLRAGHLTLKNENDLVILVAFTRKIKSVFPFVIVS
jgi:hypothetical protein